MTRRGEYSLRLIIIDRKSRRSGGDVIAKKLALISEKLVEWTDIVCLVHCIGTPVVLFFWSGAHAHDHAHEEIGWHYMIEAGLVLVASWNGLNAARTMLPELEWRLALGLALSSFLVFAFFIMGSEALMSVSLLMLIALRLHVRSLGLCTHSETCPAALGKD